MQTLPVRTEVLDFLRTSETILLAPLLMNPALTNAECDLIAECVMNLSHAKHPWSKSLILRYA